MDVFNIGPLRVIEHGVKVEYRFKLLGGGYDSSDYEIKRITKDGTETRRCRFNHNEIDTVREKPSIVWYIAGVNARGYYLCTLEINAKNRKDVKVINSFNVYKYDTIGENKLFRRDDPDKLYMFAWTKRDQKITTAIRKDINRAFRLYNKLNSLVKVKRPRKPKEEINNEQVRESHRELF